MIKISKIALLIIALQLVGCNTVAGVGDDIKKSADWTKEKISSIDKK